MGIPALQTCKAPFAPVWYYLINLLWRTFSFGKTFYAGTPGSACIAISFIIAATNGVVLLGTNTITNSFAFAGGTILFSGAAAREEEENKEELYHKVFIVYFHKIKIYRTITQGIKTLYIIVNLIYERVNGIIY